MKKSFPLYYKKFTCIADKCSDTCCAGWEIVVDGESLDKYNNMKSLYGSKIRNLITVDCDGDSVFKSCNGRCPFLLENGLCEMHKEIGHENLCRTCRNFPRFVNSFGARIETGISISCPEAARLVFESSDPVTFVTEDTEGEIIPSDFDAELYFMLLTVRKKAIDILQQRNFSIERRLCAFLEFSEVVQQCIKYNDFEKAKSVDADAFLSIKHGYSALKSKRSLNKFFSDFGLLEFINSDFSSKLKAAETVDISTFYVPDWEYEHLIIYFVFRYFITAAFDGDLLTKVKFAVISFIVIKRLHAALNCTTKQQRTEAAQKYSKEIEHSANNMDFLFTSMKKSRYYSAQNLINILSEKEIKHEIS